VGRGEFFLNGRGVDLDELLRRYPRVRVDHDNKWFYWGLLQRRYLVNRCDDCGRWHTPPYAICPSCWSPAVTATPISGVGRIDLLTFLHAGPPAEGVDYTRPYPLAGVELAEQAGLRIAAPIVNCPRADIKPGLAVRLTWTERAGNPFPAFEPHPAAGGAR
jgi:uncharacterized protein